MVRHAHGAAAAVRLSGERDGVRVEIVNGPGDGTGSGAPDGPDRARHGLIGMRERVAQLAGELSHGPEPDGGFRVTAWLPVPVAPQG